MFKALVAAYRAWRLVRIKQKIEHHSLRIVYHDIRRNMLETALRAREVK